jgi:hypothetical protein
MHWGDDEHIHAVFRCKEKRQLGGRSSKHLDCAAVGVCLCVCTCMSVPGDVRVKSRKLSRL